MKTLKKILRKIFGIKPKHKANHNKNIELPPGRMRLIHKWENPGDDGITIRSNFNRKLYHQYLQTIK